MKIYTKIVMSWDAVSNRYVTVEEESYDYRGPVALCCGASSGQKDIGSSQSGFFNTLIGQAKAVFGDASGVFNDLVNTFAPVVAAGPNQRGFSADGHTARETAATDNVAKQYANAAKATGEKMAAAGGGNAYIPSGAAGQVQGEIATAGAKELAGEQNQIEQEDFATGRSNWLDASKGLAGADSVFNPASEAAGTTNTAGADASKTQTDIAAQDNSWVNAAMGMAGTLGATGLKMIKPTP